MSLKNLTSFADLPGNLTGMAYVFIGQSFGGAVGSLFARREAGPP
ncbi:MAG: hypothetical protein PHZ19_12080 [Candidatus Thermoplasmatota archaeon]|nr:hypothetical protein [Candidatus Thermoplasmatota archaeon]